MKRNRDRAIVDGLVDCSVRAWENGIDMLYVKPGQLNALLRVGATFYARNERGVGKLYHQEVRYMAQRFVCQTKEPV